MYRTEGFAAVRLHNPHSRWSLGGWTTAELGSREAYRAIGERAPQLFIWVQSPLAGVLAAASVGFALGRTFADRIVTPLENALTSNVVAALDVRATVDQLAWHGLRTAVHGGVAAALTVRGPDFEQRRHDVGNYAWTRVWEEVGDQVYAQSWDAQARASDGLFEENLTSWANAMIEGQFGAGSMAALDTLAALGHVDPQPFTGLHRAARSCGWWWAYEAGAIFCERPASVSMEGEHVTVGFRDGWTVRT